MLTVPTYTFTGLADVGAAGAHTILTYVNYPGDIDGVMMT